MNRSTSIPKKPTNNVNVKDLQLSANLEMIVLVDKNLVVKEENEDEVEKEDDDKA